MDVDDKLSEPLAFAVFSCQLSSQPLRLHQWK